MKERTGWRDPYLDLFHPELGIYSKTLMDLSRRHRTLPNDFFATDIDFILTDAGIDQENGMIMIEYSDNCKARAIVDYKTFGAKSGPGLSSANRAVLIDLAQNRTVPIPFFVVYYDADMTGFEVHCITGNYPAKQNFDEDGYIEFMKKVRNGQY